MNDRTRIKICGLKTEEDVETAVTAGADAIGFVFAKGSPRRVDPELAAELSLLTPPFVQVVGLFVDMAPGEVARVAEIACIDMIQLHGGESERDIAALSAEFTVINAIQYDPAEVTRWGSNPDLDILLVDGSPGGLGAAFDWNALAAIQDEIEVPMMLAGGLTPDNVGEAIRSVHPYAVDVSSGVERERGAKDPALIRAFCAAVREADQGGP